MDQNTALLPALNARAAVENNSKVRAALRETISIINLKSEDPAVQAAAAKELGELGSFASKDSLSALLAEAPAGSPVAKAVHERPGANRVAQEVGEFLRHALPRPLGRQRAPRRRDRPRHHLRLDGRDQHGARRAHRGRRICDLLRAEYLRSRSRQVRHLAASGLHRCGLRCLFHCGAADRLSLRGARRHRAGAHDHQHLYRRPLESLLSDLGRLAHPAAALPAGHRLEQRAGRFARLALRQLDDS